MPDYNWHTLIYEPGDCFTSIMPLTFVHLTDDGFRAAIDFDAGENFVVVRLDQAEDRSFVSPMIEMFHTSGKKVWAWPGHFSTMYMTPMV